MKAYQSVSSMCGATGIAVLLAACGGGDGGAGGGGPVTTGPMATVTSGTITGFGSVILSDKRFETSGAAFVVDGQSGASQSDLKLGHVVTIGGTLDGSQRTALQVVQRDAVEGLVQSVAPDGLSLVVMGQTVLVDGQTFMDNNISGGNLRNLVPGADVVEVSGQVRGNGIIGATFIERKVGPLDLEVHGIIANHNTAARTFQVGSLTVLYPPSAVIGDMPNASGNAWNGLLVEVKGGAFTPGPNVQTEGSLTATKVEPDGLRVSNVARAEVEGFVRQVAGPEDFFVGNVRVVTTGGTIHRGGTPDEIVVGAKVEAEGTLTNGILTASKITFKDNVKLEADAAVVDIGAGTLTLTGLPGIVVQVTNQTEYTGLGTPTRLNDIGLGHHLRIRGRRGLGNTVVARLVERRSAESDVALQGPVESASNPTLVILGIALDTTAISDLNFEDVNDRPIGRAAFFGTVRAGTLVKVQGRLNGAVVQWREAELED